MVSLRHFRRVHRRTRNILWPNHRRALVLYLGQAGLGHIQRPGVFEAMQASACTQMIGCHLVEGAGHWVQQEQPEQVSRLLLQFVKQAREREP
jgi:pimeloyl-ACP methyl ester carboxylesterase